MKIILEKKKTSPAHSKGTMQRLRKGKSMIAKKKSAKC